MSSGKPRPQLGNLPIEVTNFVGRRRELSAARRLSQTVMLSQEQLIADGCSWGL